MRRGVDEEFELRDEAAHTPHRGTDGIRCGTGKRTPIATRRRQRRSKKSGVGLPAAGSGSRLRFSLPPCTAAVTFQVALLSHIAQTQCFHFSILRFFFKRHSVDASIDSCSHSNPGPHWHEMSSAAKDAPAASTVPQTTQMKNSVAHVLGQRSKSRFFNRYADSIRSITVGARSRRKKQEARSRSRSKKQKQKHQPPVTERPREFFVL